MPFLSTSLQRIHLNRSAQSWTYQERVNSQHHRTNRTRFPYGLRTIPDVLVVRDVSPLKADTRTNV